MSGLCVSKHCYGQTYISSGGSTEITEADTWFQIDGATYSPGEMCHFEQTDSSSAMKYVGTSPRNTLLIATISISATVADNYHFAFCKNGKVLTESTVDRQLNAGNVKGNVSLNWIVRLIDQDVVYLVVKTTSQSSTTVTTDHVAFVTFSVC